MCFFAASIRLENRIGSVAPFDSLGRLLVDPCGEGCVGGGLEAANVVTGRSSTEVMTSSTVMANFIARMRAPAPF